MVGVSAINDPLAPHTSLPEWRIVHRSPAVDIGLLVPLMVQY